MEKIFKIAASVTAPIPLAGIGFVVFLWVLKSILSKDFIAQTTKSQSFYILKHIINWVSVVVMVVTILAIAAYTWVHAAPRMAGNDPAATNRDLSLMLKNHARISVTTIPTQGPEHHVSLFEFQEDIPSIQVTKINALIRKTVEQIYLENSHYRSVDISAKPTFMDYGLLGVSVDILLEQMDAAALRPGISRDQAMLVMYMSYAHPLEKSTGLVINIANAEPYEFKDLFRFDAMPAVSKLMKSILEKSEQYFSCDAEAKVDPSLKLDPAVFTPYLGYKAEGCFSTANPKANFSLSAQAIVVKYSRYEIGPGMLGAPEVTIPFAKIGGYVNPNGPLAFLSTHL